MSILETIVSVAGRVGVKVAISRPVLHGSILCSCGRSVEVRECDRVTCRCGATLWMDVTRSNGVVSAYARINWPGPSYPWGELAPSVCALAYRPVRVD